MPALLFFGVVAAILIEQTAKTWQSLFESLLGSKHAIFRNPGQIWGGSNSTFNNPGQILIDHSLWTPSLIIQAIITAIFVGAGLFVILSKRYAPAERHWAYGALGTILGFWLRAPN
jgi:hypothetical protein